MMRKIAIISSRLILSLGITFGQSFENFSKELSNMGINIQEFSEKKSISRYELSRLLNAVECQDCLQSPIWMIDKYTNPFRSNFTQLPGKDFNDISFQGGNFQGKNYYYCVAYVGDNNYMRGYPAATSPICAGLFCGARNTNYAELIQVVINILSKYIYQNYSANRSNIYTWMLGLIPNSYPDRYLDNIDRQNINEAKDNCPQGECTITNASALKTYMKYCMFNINTCNMRTFGQITQAYRPVSELNILYDQKIIDVQRARNIDIYNNVDGKTALDILYKLYTNINCSFDNDYDCDGIPNAEDSCPYVYNPNQRDTDGDGIGDVCDDDIDNDGIKNPIGIVDDTGRINSRLLGENQDNCLFIVNNDQTDSIRDGVGDACRDSKGGLGMYISTQIVGKQLPITITADAVTKGTVIGDINRDMGDGTRRTGQVITHTYNNPGIYVIQAYANGINNNAIAKTTLIVGQADNQQRGIQIQANRINSTNGADFTFSANSIGDVEYIQRDFGDNIRVNRPINQSITREYTQAGVYSITARAFKGNTLLATSSMTIGIGNNNPGSQLISLNGLRQTINTTTNLQTQRNTTIPIKDILRDLGDGTQIRNNSTSLTHTYTIAGPRVIVQTITTQDGRQITNYITLYIQDPLYTQTFIKNFIPSNLTTTPGQVVQYTVTHQGDAIPVSSYIQRYEPTISERYTSTTKRLNHRYNMAGTYFPTNTQYINQCLFLESQATIVVQQDDMCVDILRSGRSKNYCDMDKDGIPDICDDDIDGDGVINLIGLILFDNPDCSIDERNINHELLTKHLQGVCTLDNCPFSQNTKQEDLNRDGIGDICTENIQSILTAYKSTIENNVAEKDSDGDGVPDNQDACPKIPGGFESISGCPTIGSELACPSYTTNDTISINIPRCPLNTRLCGDNICKSSCDIPDPNNPNNTISNERPCNNNSICDPLEGCECPDCLGQQDRCQNGLKCDNVNGNNRCTIDPNPQTPEIPNNPTANCTDPTVCIQWPPITPTICNQCPCQFADFVSDMIIGDKIRAILRDGTYTTLYRYSSPYLITE